MALKALSRSRLLPLSLFASMVLPALAAAIETPESASLRAGASFMEALAMPGLRMPPQAVKTALALPAVVSPATGNAGEELLDIKVHSAGQPQKQGTLVKDVDLGSLLNRQQKTSLNYTMGGKSAWLTGSFDRNQDAYFGVLEDGKNVRYYNVKDLLNAPQFVDIGSANYRLTLSPDLFDQMQSEIVLANTAVKNDKKRITLSDLIDALVATGEDVKLSDGSLYHAFYYDDPKGGTRLFAFILKDSEIHVFLVPSEFVPTGGVPSTFKMYKNKSLGLIQAGGRLKVYEN